MSGAPFLVFPWQHPFLADLKAHLDRLCGDMPGQALVVVPHHRPWRYLARLYAASGHVGPLPRVLPLTDLTAQWRARLAQAPLYTAGDLDRVAALQQAVAAVAQEDSALAARFAHMDVGRFLPWGLRLAQVFEDMFQQQVAAVDLTHMEQEVAAPAAALLGALGRIGKAYAAELRARGWTTPGLDTASVAADATDIPVLFRPTERRPVLLAGFSLLTRGEEAVLRRLWEAGAQVCLHADPALAQGGTPHWSCEPLAAWIRRWRATALPATPRFAAQNLPQAADQDTACPSPRPDYHFFAGYDLHSQLKELREVLTNAPDPPPSPEQAVATDAATAVVLTDSALLMPVLHHLPHKDVNVSMGYPLERSPLYRLLDALLRLQETRDADGRYYWRALLRCLRHPYLNLLRAAPRTPQAGPDAAVGGDGAPVAVAGPPLREALRRLEHHIRTGARFVDLSAIVPACAAEIPADQAALLHETLTLCTTGFGTATTLEDTARGLLRICDFLLLHGGDIWRRFPLDAEALYRLSRHVAPRLRDNCLAQTPLQPAVLHAVLRGMLEQERVPFEAEPLTGLQVLGMLETRLLHFDRVLIVDATDDKLPGAPAPDPLLPDALRRVLGLPDARGREKAAAYTLYRLCAGAREVCFFWQEGITRSELFDGKKSRSRFVEQLLWEEEQSRGALLEPGQGPLTAARCTLRAFAAHPQSLPRQGGLDTALRRLLRRPLSATLLDVYLECPLRFVRQYLCALEPPQEVNEGDDPAAVGICVHETLRALYAPYLQRSVRRSALGPAAVQAAFVQALASSGLEAQLPPDSLLILKEAVPMRLQRFLDNQPETTLIDALETPLDATLRLAGADYAFKGVCDRLDRRDGLLHVLDYKTGRIKLPDGDLWTDVRFFRQAGQLCDRLNGQTGEAASPAEALEDLDALFCRLCERLRSLQLPVYLLMAQAAGLGPLGDAALVDLGDTGREAPLFGGLVGEDVQAALGYCRTALELTLLHLTRAPHFAARPDKHCRYCPYAGLCTV